MIWWFILIPGSLLTLTIAGGLVFVAIKLSKSGGRSKAILLWIASILLVVVVVFLQCAIVWPKADAANTAGYENFVREEMQGEFGRPPDEVKLQRSSTVKRGIDNVYVGTARYGGDVWDVVVWWEHKKIVMEATPRRM